MKTLVIKKIAAIVRVEDISSCFDKEAVEYHTVSVVNWPEYPYQPDVKFRVAHDGENIYLNWKVDEKEIKAVCEEDGGAVWKDSCVEFFVSFNASFYYNIETNCIGKVLVGTGADRTSRKPVPSELVKKIQRWSSVGIQAISGQTGAWELSLIIPKELFYLDAIDGFSGLTGQGNFYKCGDDLEDPHFLSWNPIKNETPNFHLSDYFGKLLFQ